MRRVDRKRESRLQEVVTGLALIELDRGVLVLAAQLEPPILRALDAIHLASALSIAPVQPLVITYDHRLAAAAQVVGLVVQAPA